MCCKNLELAEYLEDKLIKKDGPVLKNFTGDEPILLCIDLCICAWMVTFSFFIILCQIVGNVN